MARKIIEHYRHATRTKPGIHLNQSGVQVARKLGKSCGPYDRVVTSPLARAIETAVAMGFAIDQTEEFLADIPDDVNRRVSYDAGFAAFAKKIEERDPVIEKYLAEMKRFHRRLLRVIPEGGRALLVSHGGVVEWAALSVYFGARKWGKSLDKCEGIRLVFKSGECVDARPLRLKKKQKKASLK